MKMKMKKIRREEFKTKKKKKPFPCIIWHQISSPWNYELNHHKLSKLINPNQQQAAPTFSQFFHITLQLEVFSSLKK